MDDREPSPDQENDQERRERSLNLVASTSNQPTSPPRETSPSSPSSLVPMVGHLLSLVPESPPHFQTLSESQPIDPADPPPKRKRNSPFPTGTDMRGGVISGQRSQQHPYDHPPPSQELPPVGSYLPLQQRVNQERTRMATYSQQPQKKYLYPVPASKWRGSDFRPTYMSNQPWTLVPREQQMVYPWAPPLHPLPTEPPPPPPPPPPLPPNALQETLVPLGQQMTYPRAPPLSAVPAQPPLPTPPNALQESVIPPGEQLMDPRARPLSPLPTQPPSPPKALQEACPSSDINDKAPTEDVTPPPEPYISAEPPIQNIECLLSNNTYNVKGQVKCPCCQSTYDINLALKERGEN